MKGSRDARCISSVEEPVSSGIEAVLKSVDENTDISEKPQGINCSEPCNPLKRLHAEYGSDWCMRKDYETLVLQSLDESCGACWKLSVISELPRLNKKGTLLELARRLVNDPTVLVDCPDIVRVFLSRFGYLLDVETLMAIIVTALKIVDDAQKNPSKNMTQLSLHVVIKMGLVVYYALTALIYKLLLEHGSLGKLIELSKRFEEEAINVFDSAIKSAIEELLEEYYWHIVAKTVEYLNQHGENYSEIISSTWDSAHDALGVSLAKVGRYDDVLTIIEKFSDVASCDIIQVYLADDSSNSLDERVLCRCDSCRNLEAAIMLGLIDCDRLSLTLALSSRRFQKRRFQKTLGGLIASCYALKGRFREALLALLISKDYPVLFNIIDIALLASASGLPRLSFSEIRDILNLNKRNVERLVHRSVEQLLAVDNIKDFINEAHRLGCSIDHDILIKAYVANGDLGKALDYVRTPWDLHLLANFLMAVYRVAGRKPSDISVLIDKIQKLGSERVLHYSSARAPFLSVVEVIGLIYGPDSAIAVIHDLKDRILRLSHVLDLYVTLVKGGLAVERIHDILEEEIKEGMCSCWSESLEKDEWIAWKLFLHARQLVMNSLVDKAADIAKMLYDACIGKELYCRLARSYVEGIVSALVTKGLRLDEVLGLLEDKRLLNPVSLRIVSVLWILRNAKRRFGRKLFKNVAVMSWKVYECLLKHVKEQGARRAAQICLADLAEQGTVT